jgi:hypothetical protein
VRKRPTRPPRFAAVPNETVDDAVQLDFMALALLTVLLRHRDGWDITMAEVGAKYGYGRDAMANAMGLLQVARYVVKIRLMSAENNQWSTEVCVYDTPATDAEVTALLAEASNEPNVRVAQVIEPTKSALENAAKRRAKLQPKGRQRAPSIAVPRVPGNPDSGATCGNAASPQVGPDCRDSRQPGDPAVFKKTVGKKTEEDEEPVPDGRRPSTGSRGSRAGGSAASGNSKPLFSRQERVQYNTFVAALPGPLKALVPKGLPQPLVRAVLDATAADNPAARTVEQLVEYRLMPKWDRYYSNQGKAGPIDKPVGVLVTMLRHDTECQDPRCDERTDVDTGEPCRLCELRGVDRRADRARNAAQGTQDSQQAPPTRVVIPFQAAPLPGRALCACGNPYFPSPEIDDARCGECRGNTLRPVGATVVGDPVRGAAAARGAMKDKAERPRR